MAEQNSEGTIVSCALIVIIICMVGSMTTGMGPVEFFFVGTVALIVITIVATVVIGGLVALFGVYKASQAEDGRSFAQKIREEYSLSVLREETGLVLVHLGQDIQTSLHKSPLIAFLSQAANSALARITTRPSSENEDDYDFLP